MHVWNAVSIAVVGLCFGCQHVGLSEVRSVSGGTTHVGLQVVKIHVPSAGVRADDTAGAECRAACASGSPIPATYQRCVAECPGTRVVVGARCTLAEIESSELCVERIIGTGPAPNWGRQRKEGRVALETLGTIVSFAGLVFLIGTSQSASYWQYGLTNAPQ